MSTLSSFLSILGILLETVAIYWTGRSVFYSLQKWYDKEIINDVISMSKKERFKAMKKEQIPIIILLTASAILQILGLLLQ